VSECSALFDPHALLISWGRIGRAPRVRLETFATGFELEARCAELLTRRRAHGYVEQRTTQVGKEELEQCGYAALAERDADVADAAE
jgi:predicted DNA-binding WGR domain protein